MILKETQNLNDDTDPLFCKACEFVSEYIKSVLVDEIGIEQLKRINDKRIYYTEGFNGFHVLESETGAFYMKQNDNDWLIQLALIADNRLVTFVRLSETDVRYAVTEFYAKGDDRSNPFKCFREFRLFRAKLKNLSPDSVIGTICVS